MKLDLTKFQAVIFDMDGTMIDNSKFHKKAWIKFAQSKGIPLTENQYYEDISGKRNDAIFEYLFKREVVGDEYNKLDEEKESLYRELYKPYLKALEGLRNFLEKLSEQKVKIAEATTAPYKNRIFVLETLALQDFFAVIVGGEETEHGKPHPEIYLKTAEKLVVDPKKFLAFEDSPAGIKAAKSADMTVIGVLTTHTKGELKEADYYIQDFTEIEI